MKVEIDNIRKLGDWMGNPAPAVFQGLDLTFDRIYQRRYPLDGSWLHWQPVSTEITTLGLQMH